ncbi:MAG: histidine kinase [Clostridia bacterium BRH_c25]|nr:MAG: histidine kinase [Clostridia bacterium BRH_c25]
MKSSEIDNLFLDDLSETKYNNHANPQRAKLAAVNFAVTIGIMTLATLLSFLFRYIGFHESNIIVAYILGVLLAAKQTDGYFYGIAASVVGVLTFNFFFTEPYYTFVTYRPDYPVTFVIMLIAAIITSTLTAKAKQEARLSFLREKRAQILYQISRSLLKVRSINQIAEVGVKNIAKLFNRSVIIATVDLSDNLGEPYIYTFKDDEHTNIFKAFTEMQVMSETFKTGNPMGAGTEIFLDSHAYYLPIKGQSGTLGVVGVSCFDNEVLSDEQKSLLELVTTQIALAMERERLSEKQQKSKMEMERERLRGNLLRAMSHDLRTPLTGILGATATILDNDDILDKKARIKLLQGVYEDASWLIHSVENILSITRIDEGGIEIKKNMEAVEEIVAEAVSRIKKLAANHIIKINIPNDLIMLPMDGTLIEQVLVNLLDNAIKYTPYGSTIEIKTRVEDDKAIFEVSDNGNGISEEDIPLIFNRFYTAATINDTGRRGTGLGLAICKSIITAHGGRISAFNNPSVGATFRFVLPAKE